MNWNCKPHSGAKALQTLFSLVGLFVLRKGRLSKLDANVPIHLRVSLQFLAKVCHRQSANCCSRHAPTIDAAPCKPRAFKSLQIFSRFSRRNETNATNCDKKLGKKKGKVYKPLLMMRSDLCRNPGFKIHLSKRNRPFEADRGTLMPLNKHHGINISGIW